MTVTVDPLDKDALMRILVEPKNAIIKQYQKFLAMDRVELIFTPEALEAAAEQALRLKTGARGLRATIEEVLTDVMFEIPSRTDVERCIVTADCILRRERPQLIVRAGRAAPAAQSA